MQDIVILTGMLPAPRPTKSVKKTAWITGPQACGKTQSLKKDDKHEHL